MIRFLPLLILLFCSACIQLGGETKPTRFYLLEATTEGNAATVTEQIQLEFSPIEFPSYLDRPQIVARNKANAIIIADHDRWAEPLSDNLIRTLQENLYKQLPGISINSAPWSGNTGPSYQINLIINRFDGTVGQQTEVDIRWTLFSTSSNEELQRKHYLAKLPIGDNYQDLVDGLNTALSELSKEIATTLIAQQR